MRGHVDATDFPYARRTLTVDGHDMAYVDEGAGPPVVLVHGNPTWSFAFRHLIEGLRADHRVIAVDHVGMGRSSRPAPGTYPYTLARRTSDLGAAIDALVPSGRVDLVVHDWGGAIGLGWATANPSRVGRVLAMNTAAFPLPDGEPLPWLLRVARSRIGRAANVRLGAFVAGTALIVSRRLLPPSVVRGYLVPYATARDRAAVAAFVDDIPLGPDDPAWSPLARTAAGLRALDGSRVTLCWGMRDPIFSPRLLDEWRRRLPAAQVVRMPNAGHLVFEDAPDAVLAVARRALSPAGAPA